MLFGRYVFYINYLYLIAGSYVFRHCEKSNPTDCGQCPTTTFTDEENGLLRCKSCTVCDSSTRTLTFMLRKPAVYPFDSVKLVFGSNRSRVKG